MCMRTSLMVRHQARHGARRKSCLVDSLPIKRRCRRRSPPKGWYPLLPELAPVRVLPDLLAVAREEERRAGEAPKRKRAAKGAGTTKPRKKIEQARTHVEPSYRSTCAAFRYAERTR